MKKTAIIGCGNMGSAIVNAMLLDKEWLIAQLVVVEKVPNRSVEEFEGKGMVTHRHVKEYKGNYEIVILAVKPQFSEAVLEDLSPKVDSDTLVISIMAGISISKLEKYLPDSQIIRCMPNMASSIHYGMTVYYGNEDVSLESFKLSQKILETLGKAFRVDDEKMIDATTAISGSGPAYLFYLAEAMRDGAIELGFNEEQALVLTTQTLLGASTLLEMSGEDPADLRKKVTSPKGTTEAALNYFEENEVKRKLIEGFKTAFERSIELGK